MTFYRSSQLVWALLVLSLVLAEVFADRSFASSGKTRTLKQSLVPTLYLKGDHLAIKTKPYRHHRRVAATVYDGILYREIDHGSGKFLEAFDLSTRLGHPYYQLAAELTASSIASKRFLYVFSRDGKITKLSRKSGTKIWQTSLSSFVIQRWISRGKLYVVTSYGDVLKLSGKTGKIQWISSLTNPPDVVYYDEDAITFMDGKLYVGGTQSVEVFSPSGDWLGAYLTSRPDEDLPGGIVGPITFHQDKVIFSRFDGSVYVFNHDDLDSSGITYHLGSPITSKLETQTGIYYGTLFGEIIFTTLAEASLKKPSLKTHSLTDQPISSMVFIHSSVASTDNTHNAEADDIADKITDKITETIVATTTKGRIFGLRNLRQIVFSTSLVSYLYAQPTLISKRKSATAHPTLLYTTTYKSIYAFAITQKPAEPNYRPH